jgi:hypothetical protein
MVTSRRRRRRQRLSRLANNPWKSTHTQHNIVTLDICVSVCVWRGPTRPSLHSQRLPFIAQLHPSIHPGVCVCVCCRPRSFQPKVPVSSNRWRWLNVTIIETVGCSLCVETGRLGSTQCFASCRVKWRGGFLLFFNREKERDWISRNNTGYRHVVFIFIYGLAISGILRNGDASIDRSSDTVEFDADDDVRFPVWRTRL